MPDPANVLFLCTGNSCRSQIAEGWMRDNGGGRFNVESAGNGRGCIGRSSRNAIGRMDRQQNETLV